MKDIQDRVSHGEMSAAVAVAELRDVQAVLVAVNAHVSEHEARLLAAS